MAEAVLVAGRDYPGSYREFVEMFPDSAACATYLERLRWPDGVVCPGCGVVAEPWRQTRGRLVCRACRHQTSVTSGTLFDKTRIPLTTWFEAAWHLTTAKNGMSAKTLERTLGTGYRTAWLMLQRYRVAMVRAGREKLCGEVEVDETLIGGVDAGGKPGRGARKGIVVIAVRWKSNNPKASVAFACAMSWMPRPSIWSILCAIQSNWARACKRMDGVATATWVQTGTCTSERCCARRAIRPTW